MGREVAASSPNPRGLVTGVAAAVDGKRLEAVEAVGKHLLLRFEGGITIRSHLRMNGRWRVGPIGALRGGLPWLVLRAGGLEATQWNGPVLTLDHRAVRRLGPDLLAEATDPAAVAALFRRVEPTRLLGEALQDQRLVAGIGNMWMSETLWAPACRPGCLSERQPTTRFSTHCSGPGRRCVPRSAGCARTVPSTGVRGVPAGVAAPSCDRAARVTTTGLPTGAPAVSAGPPSLRDRRTGSDHVDGSVAPRAPHLYASLRGFVLGAFAYLLRELDDGAELSVAFVEHEHSGGPALYEYRPLVRAFVEERAPRLRGRDDALIALEELQREPAAAIFARAHAGPRPSEDEALFRTVLLGLLVSTAEACGGFDWDDESFDRAYAELERSLYGERRTYTAVAPLVGLSVATQFELAPGLRVRTVADGELARHWPEAGSLVPKDFGRETDRYCVLELRAALAGTEDPPDAPAEIADAVSAIRLATAAPLSAGPVLFETLDGRPFGIRPVLPIAATQPPGEPTRLDSFRGALAGELLVRLALADTDSALAEALDRWELSLFQNEPFRSDQLRAAFAALLGETWPLRAAVLLEAEPGERAALHAG